VVIYAAGLAIDKVDKQHLGPMEKIKSKVLLKNLIG
jgi:hypothetical protein